MRKTVALFFILSAFLFPVISYAQEIFDLMERRDLKLQQIDSIAKKYFTEKGTGQGTGYKQYQRWFYEMQFHTDEDGFLRNENFDNDAYQATSLTTSSTQWTELGPWSWNRTSGWNPGVGRVTSIAVHPLDNNLIYITSPGGGLWKSTTGGNNWTPMTDYNSSWMNLYYVAVDPGNTQTLYVGTSGGTVIKSTNGGTSFTIISGSSGISGTVRKILIQPSNTNIIFVCSSSGIHRSVNGGANWTQVLNIQKEDIEFKADDVNVMLATGNGSSGSAIPVLHRSVDNGVTWSPITNGISTYGRSLVTVSPANPNRVYLIQASGSLLGYIYRSDDAGLSFTTMIVGSPGAGTNYFGYETNGTGTTGQAGYDMAMCANPLNADEVHIAGIICWKTTNGGTTWVAETAWSLPNIIGYNHADVHVLEWVGTTIYSGSDGGIYKSADNGDNWSDLSTGLGTRQFYRIANANNSTKRVTGGAQDNGSSLRRATGWVDWLGADGMDGLYSPLDSNLLWGTSQNGLLYRSTNGGDTRTTLGQPGTGNWVTPVAIESNSNIIYGGWDGVYKSTNNGTSWTKISGSVITGNVVCLAVAPSNPLYIYASIGGTLYTTTDGGSNWSTLSAPVTINAIAVSPLNPQKIWIAGNTSGNNRAMVSTNGGLNFTDISAGLPASTARSVTVDNTTDEGVYYGMNIGVYYKDNHSPWINLTSNLPQVAVNEVELQHSGRMLRVATYGRGLWERNMAGGYCDGDNIILPSIITGTTYQWQVNTGAGYTPVNNGDIYSGATTGTLNVNSNSSLSNYKYRCAVTTGAVTNYSAEYKLKFSATWWGEVDNNWHNPANWSCNKVPDANTDIFINAEKPRYPVVNANATVRSVYLARSASLNVTPGFTLTITAQ